MPVEELGRGVRDDVGTPLDRPAQIGRGHRVVDDQRQSGRVRHARHRLEIDHDAARIGEALHENRLAARGQRGAEIVGIAGIDEMAGPAELAKRQAELRQRAAIEVARGKELVARLQQRGEDQELRGVARGGGQRGPSALQVRHALLQHGDRGIGETAIDVAERVQVEQRGGVIDVVEGIGRGLEDRCGARACGGVGRGAGVDRARLEAVGDVVIRGLLGTATDGGGRRLGGAVADDAGVDAAPGQLPPEPAELDLRAAIHHHLQPGRLGPRASRVVAHAELHPEDARADRDGVVHDGVHVVGGAEDVHHVDRLGDVAQGGVHAFPEQLPPGERGIDRNYPVPFALQVLHDEVAWPVPVRRRAD